MSKSKRAERRKQLRQITQGLAKRAEWQLDRNRRDVVFARQRV